LTWRRQVMLEKKFSLMKTCWKKAWRRQWWKSLHCHDEIIKENTPIGIRKQRMKQCQHKRWRGACNGASNMPHKKGKIWISYSTRGLLCLLTIFKKGGWKKPLVSVRFLLLLLSCASHTFKLIITFASCFTMGMAHMEKTFAKRKSNLIVLSWTTYCES